MNITKHNFAEKFVEIDELISKSDFVSLDCEFTGLFHQDKIDLLDDYETYYQKSRESIRQFQLLQVGLSFFIQIEYNKYDCHQFNFYIFPSKCNYGSDELKERYFLSQASSLKFLVENGFDFNKVIRDGISYVPLTQLTEVEERIRKKVNNETLNVSYIEIESEEDRKFVQNITEKIEQFMKTQDQQELIFPQHNSFYRRIIYEIIEKSPFKNSLKIFTGKNENKGSIIIQKYLTRNIKEEIQSILMHHVGFSLIIKSLIKYKIPIIGHGIFLDLLYLYQTFIGSLPEDYKEFKTSIHCFFNIIYDTFFLSNSPKLKTFFPLSALEKLYSSCISDPFLPTEFHLKNSDNSNNDSSGNDHKFHDAGYDSFVTGCCFIQMIRYLFSSDSKTNEKIPNFSDNEILNCYKNKISIYGIYDLKYINLQGEDPKPNRTNVLHLQCPKNFNQKDLNLIFAEFGGLSKTIWINEESANLILKDENKISKIIESLIMNAKPTQQFKVQLYSDYIKNNENNYLKSTNKRPKSTLNSPESSLNSENCPKTKKIKNNNTDLNDFGTPEPQQQLKIEDKLFNDEDFCWNNSATETLTNLSK